MSYGFYSDIIAALRAQSQAEDHRGAGGLCRDAANEIERLQRQVKHMEDLVAGYKNLARQS